MQFLLALFLHLLADFSQRRLQTLARTAAVKFRELAKPDRSFPSRFSILISHARGIVQQNIARGVRFPAAQKLFHELLHVARRNAPSLGRKQHLLLSRLRHLRPKLPVQQIGMRFHSNPSLGHLVFARAQHLAQRFHFMAHLVEQLAHSIHAHFAALESVEREANRQIFGKFDERGAVELGFRRAGHHSGERLAQGDLRVLRQMREFFLPSVRVQILSFARALRCFSKLRKQPQQTVHFRFAERRWLARDDSGSTRDAC